MKAIHVFTEVDLRSGHIGLMEMAWKKRVDAEALRPGEAILFINKSGSGMKAYLAHRIVAYMKAKAGQSLDVTSLNGLVEAMSPGGRLESTSRIKQALGRVLKLPEGKRGVQLPLVRQPYLRTERRAG